MKLTVSARGIRMLCNAVAISTVNTTTTTLRMMKMVTTMMLIRTWEELDDVVDAGCHYRDYDDSGGVIGHNKDGDGNDYYHHTCSCANRLLTIMY